MFKQSGCRLVSSLHGHVMQSGTRDSRRPVRSPEESREKINEGVNTVASRMATGVIRQSAVAGPQKLRAPVGISILGEDSRLVIRPPVFCMPPKAHLGYNGESRGDLRAIASHYYAIASSEINTRRAFSRELVRLPASDRTAAILTDAANFERENGLCATYASRIRPVCFLEGIPGDAVSHEVPASKRIVLPITTPPSTTSSTSSEPRFYSFIVKRSGSVSHDAMIVHLTKNLQRVFSKSPTYAGVEITGSVFGMHAVDEGGGEVTVRGFLDANNPALNFVAGTEHLREVLGFGGGLAQIKVFSVEEVGTLPAPGGLVASWRILRDVRASSTSVASQLDDLKRRQRYINFFPPEQLGSHICRKVPNWAVGWHLYRMDDVQFCFAYLTRAIAMEYPKFSKILLTNPSKWKINALFQQLSRKVQEHLRAGRTEVAGLRFVLRYVSEKGFAKLCYSFQQSHPKEVGAAMAGFNRLLWNYVVSARLTSTKGVVNGDVIRKKTKVTELNGVKLSVPAFRTQIVHAEREDIQHEEIFLSAAAIEESERHSANAQSSGASDVAPSSTIEATLYPVAALFTGEDMEPGKAGLLPLHFFGRSLAEKLLMAFGLRCEDMQHGYKFLPEDFRRVKYREVVKRVDEVLLFLFLQPILAAFNWPTFYRWLHKRGVGSCTLYWRGLKFRLFVWFL